MPQGPWKQLKKTEGLDVQKKSYYGLGSAAINLKSVVWFIPVLGVSNQSQDGNGYTSSNLSVTLNPVSSGQYEIVQPRRNMWYFFNPGPVESMRYLEEGAYRMLLLNLGYGEIVI